MTGITVVKCGGHGAVDAMAVCNDVAELYHQSRRVVLVHGGSDDIDALAGQMGVVSRRLVSPDGVSTRYTDAAMLDVVTLALAGRVKPRLITALARLDVPAAGLTGLDGRLLGARRKAAHRAVIGGRQMMVRDNHSGQLTEVNTGLLANLLAAGIVPVVSPPALADDGAAVNADADRVAAVIAAALHAQTLVMLTDAPGVLADVDDESSMLPVYQVPATGAPVDVSGGMRLKLVAAREALVANVPRVLVADGRRQHPVAAAMSGEATRIVLAGAETGKIETGKIETGKIIAGSP
jgi:acetylglutamate/LysW-gamma-L-alpha-aminoadipate kinase